MDAERLKCNVSYAIQLNCCVTNVSVLKKAIESVLEHHFNNHSLSGNWCRVKDLLRQEKELAMLNYRLKLLNPVFYLQVKVFFEQFYTGLDKMLHAYGIITL